MSGVTVLWHDRAGRFSPVKAITLLIALAPALFLGWQWATGATGPRTYDFLNHATGDWTLRFLLATLAVTPFRAIFRYPKLFLIRRMLGLTALSYLIAHFTFYVAEQNFHLGFVASEIIHRLYLTIGFCALLCFITLGATSFDAAIARMGVWWRRLHMLIYAATAAGVVHYLMQSKVVSPRATFEGGLLAWLLVWRLLPSKLRTRPWFLFIYAPIAAAISAGLEVGWFRIATQVNVMRVFEANFRWGFAPRPAVWVLIWALALAALAEVRELTKPRNPA